MYLNIKSVPDCTAVQFAPIPIVVPVIVVPANDVIPEAVPPVIDTALADCVEIVPNEPVAVVTVLVTKAVLAICSVLVPAVAVGVVGTPVNVGESVLALLATAVTRLLNSVSNSEPLIILAVSVSGRESFVYLKQHY